VRRRNWKPSQVLSALQTVGGCTWRFRMWLDIVGCTQLVSRYRRMRNICFGEESGSCGKLCLAKPRRLVVFCAGNDAAFGVRASRPGGSEARKAYPAANITFACASPRILWFASAVLALFVFVRQDYVVCAVLWRSEEFRPALHLGLVVQRYSCWFFSCSPQTTRHKKTKE